LVCGAATLPWLCAAAVCTAANKTIDAAVTHIDHPEANAKLFRINWLRKKTLRMGST
jgi:hypothetical protein